MLITANFTNSGVPQDGLTPTIRIINLPNIVDISGAAMTEISDLSGSYYYDFTTYNITGNYNIRCDGGPTLSNYDRYTWGGNDDEITDLVYDANRLRYRGSVWIDDTAANVNTVLGEDGTPEKPVSTLAAALTIAAALNVQSLSLMNNTSISLSQSFADWEIIGFGHGNIVTLNSQSIDNAKLSNLEVTGTQGGSACAFFFHCHLDSIINLNACGKFCMFIGNCTIVASSEVFFFDFCSSAVPGNNTPILTFSAGVTAVSFRHYSGGLEIKSMTADHVMSYETDGQIIINANCTGGALSIRGNMTKTDNSGLVTITEGAALNRDAIGDAVMEEPMSGHTTVGSFGERTTIIQGLLHKNLYTTAYWDDDDMTGAQIKLYDSAFNAGVHSASGLLLTLGLTGTFTAGKMQTVLVVEE